MPRIDPAQLLKTLKVLLSPESGGIKGSSEVVKIVQLMQKFSKKLVSKVIYIQILKSTDPELLEEFLSNNGWELLNQWFSDAIRNQNWALCLEMITLFAVCPITADRLRDNVDENQAPRLINQLRQEPTIDQGIRSVAADVYGKWVAVVSPKVGLKVPVAAARATRKTRLSVKAPKPVSNELIQDTDSSDDDGSGEEITKPSVMRAEVKKTGSISLLQSLADEVSETIKKEEVKKKEDEAKKKAAKEKKESVIVKDSKKEAKSSSHRGHHTSSHHGTKRKETDRRSSKESKRFRPDPRDEVDDEEKKRIKEMARRMREEAQAKKDKETLSKVSSSASLGKIPKIPKKPVDKSDKSKNSFEDMLGTLDAKPKTIKTPMNKNKTAAMLEGMSSVKPSSGSTSSSSKHRHHHSSKDKSSSKSSSHSHHHRDHHHHHHSSSKKDSISSPSSKSKDTSKRHNSGEKKLTMPEQKTRKSSIDAGDSPKSLKGPNYSESTSFMDAIFGSINKVDQHKKLRKRGLSDRESDSKVKEEKSDQPTEKKAANGDSKSAEPVEEKAIQPFSFYQDTLETKVEDEEDASKEEETMSDEKKEGSKSPAESKDAVESSGNEEESKDTLPREVKGILVYHRGRDKRDKRIKWKPDSDIVAIKYFELDEGERINVNRVKFETMRNFELNMEKAALKQKDNMMEEKEHVMNWYTPIKLSFDPERKPLLAEAGANSKEVEIQAKREAGVLQALYFTKDMTPANPAEPDAIEVSRETPKLIPLEDKEADESSFQDYSVKGWPEPKVNQVDQQANLQAAFSLPPALSNLLSTIGTQGLAGILPPPGANLSEEDQTMLAAQTEALQKMGILPGVNMPPSFPPPPPPVHQPPPRVEPFDRGMMNNPPPFGMPPPGLHNNGFAPFDVKAGGGPPPFDNNFRNGNNARNPNFGNRGGGGFRNDRRGNHNQGNWDNDQYGRPPPMSKKEQEYKDSKIGTRPCKFYSMRGSCRDGDRCRYIHQRN